MSAEKLTAEDILNKHDDRVSVYYKKALAAMEEYAASKVEQQTKLLKEERDRAIQLLQMLIWRSAIKVFPKDQNPPKKQVNDFLDQLNQNNEEPDQSDPF